MKAHLLKGAAASICMTMALMWAVESSAMTILDQSSEIGTQLGTLGQPDNAQTFTVGLQGTLAEVQVQVQRNSANADDLVLDVRETSAGTPLEDDTNVLAGTTISAASLPFNTPTWVSFDVSSFGIDVDVGDILAIALRVPTTTDPANYFWIGNAGGDPYAGGQRWGRSDTWSGGVLGGTWNGSFAEFATTDMNFRTFVEPVPIPPTFLLFGSGLLGLIGVSRRKKSA